MNQTARTNKEKHYNPFSLKIGRIFGIPIRLHITFLLFIAWIAAMDRHSARSATVFVIVLFVCVLFHELGHALCAQIFNMQTADITLYPIGGIARIEGEFEPKSEFWIALAGPLVNVVIALSIALGFLIRHQPFPPKMWLIEPQNQFMASVFSANFMLAIFNLVPAFPMDGGRVLRSLLSMKFGESQGTKFAAILGQIMAFALAMIGFYLSNIILLLIAVFIFFEAGSSFLAERQKHAFFDNTISDAMDSQCQSAQPGQTIEEIARLMVQSGQQILPVTIEGEPVGILTRSAIIQSLANEIKDQYVADLMEKNFRTIEPTESLRDGILMLQKDASVPVLIVQNGRFIGMLTAEKVNEFILSAHSSSPFSAGNL